MTLQEFSSYAASRGMIVADQMAFGELRGYPFAIAVKGNQFRSMTASFKLAQRLPKKVWKSIKTSLNGGGKLFYFNNDPLLIGLTCAGSDQELWNRMFAAMDVVTQGLYEAGIAISQVCPLCSGANCDSLAMVGDGYVPVHKMCCENQAYSAVAEAEANQNSGHYLTGILGALLGGIIATIPTILLMWFANLISAWLYALIPLGAYYGYRICKGRMSKAVLPIVILISILQLFFVQQVMWYLTLHEEFGVWPYVHESIAYFIEFVELNVMLTDLLQPALFTALGIFISYGIIRKNNHTTTSHANLVLRSLFVKNGAQSAAQPQNVEAAAWNPQPLQSGEAASWQAEPPKDEIQ